MNFLKKTILLLILIVYLVCIVGCRIEEGEETEVTVKLALVHSYHPEYSWCEEINQGLVYGLMQSNYFEGKNLEIEEYYMYTKNINTEETQKISVGNQIANQIKDSSDVSLVVTSDDDAFSYVVPQLYEAGYPIVFHGISILPEIYNQTFHFFNTRENPGMNITGVSKITPFVETVLLYRRILSNSNHRFEKKKFLVLFDSTITGNAMKEQYEEEIAKDEMIERLAPYNITIEAKQIETFEEYKKEINDINNNSVFSGVYPLVFSLKSSIDSTKAYTANDIYTWTGENCLKPSLGLTTSFCEQGLLGGFGISATDSGYQTGLIAGRFLFGTISKLGDIAFEMNPRKNIFFNLNIAEKLGIEIDQFYIDKASDVFYTPNNTLLYTLLISIPMTIVSFVFIGILSSVVFGFWSCSRIEKKKFQWMTTIAEEISNLNLESLKIIELEKNYSKKGKIGSIFIKIINKLKQFKPYLPSSLFVIDTEDDKDEDPSSLSLLSISSSQSQSSQSSNNSDGTETMSSNNSSFLSSINSSNSKNSDYQRKQRRKRKSMMEKLGLSLEQKQFTVLLCKLTGFSELIKPKLRKSKSNSKVNEKFGEVMEIEQMSSENVLCILNDFIEIVSNAVGKSFGNINFIQGSQILISYNTVRTQASTHSKKACDTALMIQSNFKPKINDWKRKGILNKSKIGSDNELLNVHMAINTTNESGCFCGNIGTKTIRSFNLIGNEVEEQLNSLIDLNHTYQTQIILNDNCCQLVKFGYNIRSLDVLPNKENSDLTSVIHELVSSRGQIKQNEWLYELQNLENKSIYKLYNLGFENWKNGNLEDAKANILEFLDFHKTNDMTQEENEETFLKKKKLIQQGNYFLKKIQNGLTEVPPHSL